MTGATGNKFMRRTVWEDLTPEQVVERYAAGESMEGIGFVMGTGARAVRKILVDHGVTIRTAAGCLGRANGRYTRS